MKVVGIQNRSSKFSDVIRLFDDARALIEEGGRRAEGRKGAPWNAKCAYRPENRRSARGDAAKVLVDSLKTTLGSGVRHIEQSAVMARFLLHPL